ncbi:MAG: galactokinase [Anaerolineales bacterium]|nr:galactokinase [Anaerolineales bacterium]
MQAKIITAFEQRFGTPPTYLTRAPGRVNLIGEHTDYNQGFVLPMAIDRHVWIAAVPHADPLLTIHSLDFNETISIDLDSLADNTLPHWTSYTRGVWYYVGQKAPQLGGVKMVIGGNVPMGAGLSSSAAIEMATVELALALINEKWTAAEKAQVGVKAEHDFAHVKCGNMDQTISAAALEGCALRIDCRAYDFLPVHLPDGVSVVVMDTHKRHQLVETEYNVRRTQCTEAAEILQVESLRDATLEQVKATHDELGDVRYRRAHHIVTENKRVLDFAEATEAKNLDLAGQLMNESHFSLRDDFEVSCTELDIMSDIARHQAGCYGARMTGGGFGGSAVALVQSTAVAEFMAAVAPAYEAATGLTPTLYEFKPASGSTVIFRP